MDIHLHSLLLMPYLQDVHVRISAPKVCLDEIIAQGNFLHVGEFSFVPYEQQIHTNQPGGPGINWTIFIQRCLSFTFWIVTVAVHAFDFQGVFCPPIQENHSVQTVSNNCCSNQEYTETLTLPESWVFSVCSATSLSGIAMSHRPCTVTSVKRLGDARFICDTHTHTHTVKASCQSSFGRIKECPTYAESD